jgi:integrase
MDNLHYNYKQVKLNAFFDKRNGIHYLRYKLPSMPLGNRKYKERRFRKDESLRFIFKEGYNYTHHTDKQGNPVKLNPLQKSNNKKYLNRLNEIIAERQTDISRGEYQIPSIASSNCFFEYLDQHKIKARKNYSYNTKAGYNSLEKHLRCFYRSNTLPFAVLDESFAEKFMGYLINDAPNVLSSKNNGKLSPITVLKRMKDFKYVVGQAVNDKIIPYHPFSEFQMYEKGKTPQSRFGDWMTPEEIKLLLDNPLPYEEIHNYFMFSCNSSMAFAECYALTWGQISDFEEYSTIKYTRKKTEKPRTLHISNQARDYLGDRGIYDSKVFNITKNVDDINKRLQMWAKMSGVNKHLTTHAGKRTFAYCFYKKTKNILALQKILGHNNLKSTQRYISAFQIDTESVVSRLTLTGGLF